MTYIFSMLGIVLLAFLSPAMAEGSPLPERRLNLYLGGSIGYISMGSLAIEQPLADGTIDAFKAPWTADYQHGAIAGFSYRFHARYDVFFEWQYTSADFTYHVAEGSFFLDSARNILAVGSSYYIRPSVSIGAFGGYSPNPRTSIIPEPWPGYMVNAKTTNNWGLGVKIEYMPVPYFAIGFMYVLYTKHRVYEFTSNGSPFHEGLIIDVPAMSTFALRIRVIV